MDIIEEQASKADIVLNTADADDLELTKAILRGIKRTTAGGKRPILIHTSGTGVASKKPTGIFDPNQKVYNVSFDSSLGHICLTYDAGQ